MAFSEGMLHLQIPNCTCSLFSIHYKGNTKFNHFQGTLNLVLQIKLVLDQHEVNLNVFYRLSKYKHYIKHSLVICLLMFYVL